MMRPHPPRQQPRHMSWGSAIVAMVIVLIAFAILVGTMLYAMRQQRLQYMHQITALHSQVNQHREDLWGLQTKIAENVGPMKLHESIEQAQLELEPVIAATEADDNLLTAIELHHVND